MFLELLTIFTPVAYADIDTFVRKLNTYVFNPLIVLMVIIAVAVFIYGMFEYIRGADSDDAREKGQRHMLWSVIGLFIMIGVFFIMRVILGSVGIDETQINVQTGEVNIVQ
jgi:uncharacterized membrane protein YidH (DUF202 family)